MAGQVEAGDAASTPTQPFKAELIRVTTSASEEQALELARSHHSLTVIGNKAYIFGGSRPDGQLFSNDVHVLSLSASNRHALYKSYPTPPVEDAAGDSSAPAPRAHHAATSHGSKLVIHGGCGADGKLVDNGLALWLWDSGRLKWSRNDPDIELYTTLAPRRNHYIFVDQRQNFLVLHGGRKSADPTAPMCQETWFYDFEMNAWTTMPPSPAPALSATYADETLYIISGGSGSGGAVHYMKLQHNEEDRAKKDALVWRTVDFPSNPPMPGLTPRIGATLVPVTTGLGRHFLIYMLGKSESTADSGEPSYPTETWSLQLPPSTLSPAGIKDLFRNKVLKQQTGGFHWSQVHLEYPSGARSDDESHPVPRTFAGASTCLAGKAIMIWGGSSDKNEAVPDGWVLQISQEPYREVLNQYVGKR